MKNKYLIIFDKINKWKITGITDSDMESYDPSMFYKITDEELFLYISGLFKDEKNELFVSKEKLGYIGAKIIKSDIEIQIINELSKQKENTFSKIKELISMKFSVIDIFSIFEFSLIINKFANKGIYLTEENSLEKFQKFIDNNDEDNILLLQNFIDKTKQMKLLNNWYDLYISSIKKLNKAENIEEVESVYKEFLDKC